MNRAGTYPAPLLGDEGLCKALLAVARERRGKEETADATQTTAAAPGLGEPTRPTAGPGAAVAGPRAAVAGPGPGEAPGAAAAGPGPVEAPGATAEPRPAEAPGPAAAPGPPEARQKMASGQEAEAPGTRPRSRKSVALADEREV
ncbi:hypothetical protein NDU88_005709 [Pleurodeles waltl]|uniref:Uncharacterized protein n=1 Tax=Pleurodeles waltl TaxID=8319 RepID=A0AAV7WAC0_PLEWA|nr:hypothetical protein NDU88_005709 [Pleurodeles waltl]